MKTKSLKLGAALALAATMSGCDWFAAREFKEDRNERLYKTAMADYSAGRIDAAVTGFEKTLRANPANTSARFQLASLLQDHRRDYLAAMCQYREYLLQSPESDKSALAAERVQICERQYAAYLLNQLKDGEGPVAKEIARLRANAEADAEEIARLKVELEQTISERDAARRECELARNLVRSLGDEESTEGPKFDMATAKALLDEEDDEGIDRIKFSADVKNLLAEEESEKTATPFAVAPKPEPVQQVEKSPEEERPETYVVQEGDTLYKIALKFYGKRSAWTRIRDANKAVISTDGRVNAGVTIKLPK